MIATESAGQYVEVGGDIYEATTTDIGEIVSLKRYNKKFKMWVQINFPNEVNKEIDKTIIDILSKQFIEKATSI